MLRNILLLTGIVIFSIGNANAYAKTLFYDDFNDNKVAVVYKYSGVDLPQTSAGKGEWVEKGGIFSQTNDKQGDECHAAIMMDFPELITIQAKIRLDTWQNGDTARGGLALRVGKSTGRGYNFLFHNVLGTIQFLNDQSAWGSTGSFNYEVNKGYWMQLTIDKDGMLHGKVWADGEKEPTKWNLEQQKFGDERPWKDGYPALNGGTSPHGGLVTVSFDDVCVFDEQGPSPVAVSILDKAISTWATIKQTP